jgi:hypothetical protein
MEVPMMSKSSESSESRNSAEITSSTASGVRGVYAASVINSMWTWGGTLVIQYQDDHWHFVQAKDYL